MFVPALLSEAFSTPKTCTMWRSKQTILRNLPRFFREDLVLLPNRCFLVGPRVAMIFDPKKPNVKTMGNLQAALGLCLLPKCGAARGGGNSEGHVSRHFFGVLIV